MSNLAYSIRNYIPADRAGYIRLVGEAERLEPAGRCVWPAAVTARLNRPGYFPAKYLYLAEMDSRLIGYMDIEPELASERIILNCWLHPEHRRKGLGRKLYSRARSRIEGLPVTEARVNVPQDNSGAGTFLSRLGFKVGGEFLELRWEDAAPPVQTAAGTVFDLHPLRRNGAAELTRLQNRCFAGAWEFNPNTVEEVAYLTCSAPCSPGDIVLAYDRAKAIGYCWTAAIPDADGRKTRGKVLMLGVAPDYRGQGLGQTLLLAGIARLQGQGIVTIDITVNSENEVARTLYQSLGFKVRTSTLWYCKFLDQLSINTGMDAAD